MDNVDIYRTIINLSYETAGRHLDFYDTILSVMKKMKKQFFNANENVFIINVLSAVAVPNQCGHEIHII